MAKNFNKKITHIKIEEQVTVKASYMLKNFAWPRRNIGASMSTVVSIYIDLSSTIKVFYAICFQIVL